MTENELNFTSDPVLDAKYDNLFKQIVTAQWGVKSNGDVESPTGYFGLVEIPSHVGERNEMRDAVFGDEPFSDDEFTNLTSWPDAGWYITQEMDSGIIWVYRMASQAGAEREYAKLERTYAEWDADGLDV